MNDLDREIENSRREDSQVSWSFSSVRKSEESKVVYEKYRIKLGTEKRRKNWINRTVYVLREKKEKIVLF